MIHAEFKKLKTLISFTLLVIVLYTSAAASPKEIFNITDFGAVSDGTTKDTQSIQKAIDAANEAGGGTVYFPAGTYLSGTLVLKDHVTLHLEGGSTLLGSTDLADFPSTPPRFRSYTEKYVHQSLLFGEDLVNITIEGRGTIDGQGTIYRELNRQFRERPYLIRLVSCRNVHVRDITLQNSPFWVQHYLACDDPVIEVAVLYPDTKSKLDDGVFRNLYAFTFNKRAADLRSHLDYDFCNQ